MKISTGAFRTAWAEELPAFLKKVNDYYAPLSLSQLEEMYSEKPEHFLVHDKDPSTYLSLIGPWRDGSDIAGIFLFNPPSGTAQELLNQIISILKYDGFKSVVSPPTPILLLKHYLRSGFNSFEALRFYKKTNYLIFANKHFDLSDSTCEAFNGSDIDEIIEIDSESFDNFWRYTKKEVIDLLKHSDCIIRKNGRHIAGFLIYNTQGRSGMIVRLAVKERYRRQGIGTELMQVALACMISKKIKLVSLCTQETNKTAQSFYDKNGFRRLSDVYQILKLDL